MPTPTTSVWYRGRALVRACRPRQWVKNVLVAAAPAAAGQLLQPAVAVRTLLAFVALTLAASATYLVNDVRDRAADAAHPTKRHRPIAAGILPVPAAAAAAAVTASAAVGLPLAAGHPGLAVVVGAYLAVTSAYSAGLKHLALVDITTVTAGFVLRAVAGAVVTGVPVSKWFLIVVSFGALYLAATKRHAELRDHGSDSRTALDGYGPAMLTEIRHTASAVTIVAYVLWAFEAAAGTGGMWFELSIAPFVLALYRYAAAVEQGRGQAPEQILTRDRPTLAFAAVWAVCYLGGVYVG